MTVAALLTFTLKDGKAQVDMSVFKYSIHTPVNKVAAEERNMKDLFSLNLAESLGPSESPPSRSHIFLLEDMAVLVQVNFRLGCDVLMVPRKI
jgi:hypothetical protein